MKVLIFGGSGFIGKHLIPVLVHEGYEVFLFTRNPAAVAKSFSDKVTTIEWDARFPQLITEHFTGDYLIINLAGESIGARLWTKKQKQKIRSSRITITTAIAGIVRLSPVKPSVVLQGSAIGYYGSQSDKQLVESSPKGNGFLADVVDEWEKSAKPLEDFNSRMIYSRTGIVLGNDGGILPLMLLPFKFYAGGHIGNGRQWFSWIHIEDVVNAMVFLIKKENASGIYNLTSPEPIQMRDFTRLTGKALGKPSWLHIPAFALNVLPEGMADDLLLTSQRVIPARLLDAGYRFIFANTRDALDDLILNKKKMSDCVGVNFIYKDLEIPSPKFSDEWMQSDNLVYEVIRVEEGVPLFIEDYLDRLEKTIQLSGLKIDFNRKKIYDRVIRLIAINNGINGPVKLMISENSSVLHYMKPHLPLPEEYFTGVKTIFIREERINPNAKIWNPAFRSKIITALQETGAYEAILVNQNDEITEGSRSNIFFVKGSELYTAFTAAVLPGITRMKVLSACNLLGLKVNEIPLPLNDLGGFDSAFLTGTSRKVLPIRLIGDLTFRADNEVIKTISTTFEKLTADYILKWKSLHNG